MSNVMSMFWLALLGVNFGVISAVTNLPTIFPSSGKEWRDEMPKYSFYKTHVLIHGGRY